MVSEHPGVFATLWEAFSYPDMRALSERVAAKGINQLLQDLCALADQDHPLNIHMLGHSMGCRVVCQALSSLMQVPTALAHVVNCIRLNVILFEGAIDNNTLAIGGKYSALSQVPGFRFQPRILVTKSNLDYVLEDYPPDDGASKAMGFVGPTAETFVAPSRLSGQGSTIAIGSGATYTVVTPQRCIVADLTQLHQAHGKGPSSNPNEWAGLSGHHSDIFCPEIYEMVTGFLFS